MSVLEKYLQRADGVREFALTNLIRDVLRSHPSWPSTFGPCPVDGCANSGRGAGPCADCLVEAIAELTGDREAAVDLDLAAIAQTRAIMRLHDTLDMCEL
jgi:hypothetical protein